ADAGVHAVATAELGEVVIAAIPGDPEVAHLEGRRVGEVELADRQCRQIRDALAELGGQIPATAPAVQQLGGSVVMAVVVAAGQVDAVALASQYDGIGPQEGVFLRDLLKGAT